jgi:hypothetical protein
VNFKLNSQSDDDMDHTIPANRASSQSTGANIGTSTVVSIGETVLHQPQPLEEEEEEEEEEDLPVPPATETPPPIEAPPPQPLLPPEPAVRRAERNPGKRVMTDAEVEAAFNRILPSLEAMSDSSEIDVTPEALNRAIAAAQSSDSGN